MKKDKLLSIIVPVYNTAEYLRQCLESIIHQTYQNLEIILVVDGGSTDGSTEICEEYAALDKRIRLLYRPHEGLISARKAAVMTATGKYVAYVDSDDWIDLDMYEKLLTSMGNMSPDVLLHGYQSEYVEKTVICQYSIPAGYYDKAGLHDEIYPRLLKTRRTYRWEFLPEHLKSRDVKELFFQGEMRPSLQSEVFENVWLKIVKREILQKSQMMVPDDVIIGEDLVCSLHTLFLAESIMVVNIASYHYRQRRISGSHGDIPVEQYRKLFFAVRTAVLHQPLADKYLVRLDQMILRQLLVSGPGYEMFLDGQYSHVLFGNLDGQCVALYGAGVCGQVIYRKTKAIFPDRIVLWIDRQYEKYQREGLPVEPVEELLHQDYDAVIIALVDENVCEEIKCDLIKMGIKTEKIRYPTASPEVLEVIEGIMQADKNGCA